jgi:hypothetical protein
MRWTKPRKTAMRMVGWDTVKGPAQRAELYCARVFADRLKPKLR